MPITLSHNPMSSNILFSLTKKTALKPQNITFTIMWDKETHQILIFEKVEPMGVASQIIKVVADPFSFSRQIIAALFTRNEGAFWSVIGLNRPIWQVTVC